ncbi:MAG: sensor histidine kinase, partial [Elstera sp.]
AELLRDALDPDEPAMTPETQRRFLSNIIADTDRLTRLLAQLRDLARAETLPTPGACTLAAFLPDWAETLAGLKVIWNGDIETEVALPTESLQMVLGHLAENAAQHGAQRLSLDAKADGAVLSLRVCDDGPGIDPQNRDQIFESFFTTQQTRGGTGLGLAIVRASLGAYRGTITLADSGPLPGACFVLTLPRNQ